MAQAFSPSATPWDLVDVRVWLWRYLRPRDALQALMLITTLVALIALHSVSRSLTFGLGMVYGVLFASAVADVLRSREARDSVQAKVFAAACAEMNKIVFKEHADRTRFTLFVEPSSQPGLIVPWYRYEEGVKDSIAAASKSRARYKRGEGITGRGWAEPQRLLLAVFPDFHSSDEEFRSYYEEKVGIRPEVVRDLNASYMSKVGAIFAYGFVDEQNDVVGVLSLDIQAPAEFANGQLRLSGVDFDANGMFLILRSIRNALVGASASV